jgi:hypothetical protein
VRIAGAERRRRRRLRHALMAPLLLLASCASAPQRNSVAAPALQLPPAALGREISLQQRLTVTHAGRQQQADALLEVDASSLRLVMLVGPRRLLTLSWDGSQLQQQRDPALPEALEGEHFVNDIQLAYWPAAAIRQRLTAPWTLQEQTGSRALLHNGSVIVSIRYSSAIPWLGHIEIDRPAQDYRLSIDSVSAQ